MNARFDVAPPPLYFFERTVRPLSLEERQRYHEENMVAAELVLLPREKVPATVEGTEDYVWEMVESDTMMLTDVARTSPTSSARVRSREA